MKRNPRTLHLPPNILWPAGCINRNEISTLPSYLRHDPDAIGLHPPCADGHAHPASWLLPEFSLVDIVRCGVVCQRDRSGIYGEFPQVIFKDMIPMRRVELVETDGVIFQDMPPLRGSIDFHR